MIAEPKLSPHVDAEAGPVAHRELRTDRGDIGWAAQEPPGVVLVVMLRANVSRDDVDLIEADAAYGEASADRALREVVRVLHAIEPLLLDRRDQLSVFEQDGSGVMAAVTRAVVGAEDCVAAVDAEDQHRRQLPEFAYDVELGQGKRAPWSVQRAPASFSFRTSSSRRNDDAC